MEHPLVDVIRGDNRQIPEEVPPLLGPDLVEYFLAVVRQPREVPRVEAYPERGVPEVVKGEGDEDEVLHAGGQGVVGVHQGQEGGGEGDGVDYEGGELAVVGVVVGELRAIGEDHFLGGGGGFVFVSFVEQKKIKDDDDYDDCAHPLTTARTL